MSDLPPATIGFAAGLLGIGISMLLGQPGFERKLILDRGIDTAVTSGLGWVAPQVAWGQAS